MKKRIVIFLCCLSIIGCTVFHNVTAFATSEATTESAEDIEVVESTATDIATDIAGFVQTVLPITSLDDVISNIASSLVSEDGVWYHLVNNPDVSYAISGGGGLARSGGGGGGGKNRLVQSADDIDISGETFAYICDRLAEQYAPDAKTEYISWRCKTSSPLPQQLPIYQYGEGLVGGSDICYFQPFFVTEEGNYYFSDYQYELKIIDTVLHVAGMNVLSESEFTSLSSINNTLNISSYPYISLLAYPYYVSGYTYRRPMLMFGFESYTKYLQDKNDNVWAAYGNDQKYGYYFNHDLSHQVDIKYIYESFSGDPVEGEVKDIGYYISTEPIDMNGRIQPIPTEHLTGTTVTVRGDTIYDYTITNKDGDTSTVNYFVNNNYTYENIYTDNDTDTDSGTSGGGASGDVTVGGTVGVNGNIGVNGSVDININVEQGSGVTSESPSLMPVEVNLNDYLEKTPDQAKPITQYFEVFFEFLPPELLALICLGVVVAILLRIWGR